MVTVWIIIAIIHLGSLLFLYAFIKRLFLFVRKNRLNESKYTLLFGWIRLSYVISTYLICMIIFIITSFYLLLYIK